MKNRREFLQLSFDEKGTAAIEFGLVATFLSFMVIGSTDFAMGYWEQMQVGNAVRAGAQYAIANSSSLSTTWNQSAIQNVQNAVTKATSLGSIVATPAPTQTCGCPSATTGITTATCGSNCASGGTAGTYVTVNAQASYSTILTYPGISSTNSGNSILLTASMMVRIN